ncbi:MAG: BMP family protein [Gemmatimonadaceae bacterium]|nr:BMP family protein [Gemmatimonadaceae bacterium]
MPLRFQPPVLRFATLFHLALWTTVSCGKPAAKAGTEPTFSVALLTPGPISDKSWNASAYEGLTRIKDSLDAAVSHVQTKTPAEFEENFRQYAAKGYRLAFGHGFEFQDAAMRVGAEAPKTIFVTTGGAKVAGNVAAMSFAFDEPSFLAGMVAAAASKSGVIGCIGGTELPPVKTSFAAFAAGAKLVRPDIRVLTAYIGNWDDASAGKEQALAQMGRGADVIFQNADAAGLGIFQAVRESASALIVGSNANQNALLAERALGSVVIDVPRAFLSVAREVQAGTFTARVIRMDTRSDVVRWEANAALADRVSAPVRARVDSVLATMRAGTFTASYDGR